MTMLVASVTISVMGTTVLPVPSSLLSQMSGGSSMQSMFPRPSHQLRLLVKSGRGAKAGGWREQSGGPGISYPLFWWSPKFLHGLSSPGWLWFPVVANQVASLSSQGLCFPDWTLISPIVHFSCSPRTTYHSPLNPQDQQGDAASFSHKHPPPVSAFVVSSDYFMPSASSLSKAHPKSALLGPTEMPPPT